MLGLDSIYNTIYSYFYPEESEDAGSLNEELGTLNGYQIVRLSPDMEKDITVQKAIETAQVIFLLDIHTCKDMHKANAKVLNRFFNLDHDMLLVEGFFDVKTCKKYHLAKGLDDSVAPIPKKILKKASSWEPYNSLADAQADTYSTTLFIEGTTCLWKALAAIALDSRGSYDSTQGFDFLKQADFAIQYCMGKDAMEPAALKEKLQKQSYAERLSFIEELCQKQASLLKEALCPFTVAFSKRTTSLIEKTLHRLLDQRAQKVWITCGAGHGIGDFYTHDHVERTYAALDEKKISYVTLYKETPISLIMNKDRPTRGENYKKVEHKIREASEHILERATKIEHEAYENNLSVAEAFKDEMSHQSGELSLYLSEKTSNHVHTLSQAVASLNRIAYWARKFRDNLEAKTAAA